MQIFLKKRVKISVLLNPVNRKDNYYADDCFSAGSEYHS